MNIDKVIGRRERRYQAELLRHTRKCRICNHPRRAEIEQDFLNWRNPREIVDEYELAHHSAIYRHARALGLTDRRIANAYMALDLIVEKAETAKVTGHTVIRAIRAYSRLTRKGRWVELPKRVIFERVRKSRAPKPATREPASSQSVVAPVPPSAPDAPHAACRAPDSVGSSVAARRLRAASPPEPALSQQFKAYFMKSSRIKTPLARPSCWRAGQLPLSADQLPPGSFAAAGKRPSATPKF
jgi:hypothetical protein